MKLSISEPKQFMNLTLSKTTGESIDIVEFPQFRNVRFLTMTTSAELKESAL